MNIYYDIVQRQNLYGLVLLVLKVVVDQLALGFLAWSFLTYLYFGKSFLES